LKNCIFVISLGKRERATVAQVVVVDGAHEAGILASSTILLALKEKPNLVLGLATGASPQPVYRSLASRISNQHIDVSLVRGFALDEYVGLSPDHPASYNSTINREVVLPMGLDPDRVLVPRGKVAEVSHAGEDFEEQLTQSGGVDIQILGVGSNGHVGFNEPGSSLASLTRVKTLTEQTRSDNARFFDSPEEVPTHCVTQGIGTILRARRIILLAFGLSKAQALSRAVEGPITSSCPASAIQLHPRVTVLADLEAASQLTQLDYYQRAWQSRPDWQRL
jgi:glucosamine-6-phosphate deaminase